MKKLILLPLFFVICFKLFSQNSSTPATQVTVQFNYCEVTITKDPSLLPGWDVVVDDGSEFGGNSIPYLMKYQKHFENCPRVLIANIMGKQGWEMIDVQFEQGNVLYTFKKKADTNKSAEIKK